MINKLRNKFILILMSFTTAVLLIGTVAICIISYNSELNNEDARLSTVIESAATPKPEGRNASAPPEIGGREMFKTMNNPVSLYTQEEHSKEIKPIDQFSTATIPNDIFNNVNEQIANSNDGIYVLSDDGLVYKKMTIGNTSFIAISDIGNINYWTRVLVPLIISDILILIVFFILSIFLSKISVKPVKEAWNKQKQFIADASHDLKTPLAVIMANNSILQTNKNNKIIDEIEWIESNETEAEKMLDLINGMLDLAKVENPEFAKKELISQFEKINLSELLTMCCLQFESIAFEENLKFITKIEENTYVLGLKKDIAKMIDTITSNAFKYAPQDDTITIASYTSNKKVLIDIQNEKSFISEDDLPHIFDRFYRSDKSRTSVSNEKHQSHGLGLAISKSIAELHNGSLSAKSSKTEGTTFTISLPLA